MLGKRPPTWASSAPKHQSFRSTAEVPTTAAFTRFQSGIWKRKPRCMAVALLRGSVTHEAFTQVEPSKLSKLSKLSTLQIRRNHQENPPGLWWFCFYTLSILAFRTLSFVVYSSSLKVLGRRPTCISAGPSLEATWQSIQVLRIQPIPKLMPKLIADLSVSPSFSESFLGPRSLPKTPSNAFAPWLVRKISPWAPGWLLQITPNSCTGVTTWYKFNIVNVCQHSSTNMLNIVWTEPPTNIEEHILSKESPSFLQSSRLEVDHIQIHQIWKIFWMIWKISKTVKMFLVNSCWWQLQTLQLSDLWLLAASCLQSAILARCVPTSNHSAPIITNHHESSRIITNHHESGCHTMPYHAAPCRTQPLQVVCSSHVQQPGQPRAQWSLLVPISPTISILNTVMQPTWSSLWDGCNPNICSVAVEPT